MKDLVSLMKQVKNKTLMVVYPHPDDESFGAGGLLLVARELGFKTVVVTLTDGGAGKIHINLRGKSIREVRREELTRAVRLLKVDELVVGNFDDARLRQQRARWSGWLQNILVEYKPGVVVTYDHSGMSGHPDHIILSLELKKLVSKNTTLLWTSVFGKLRNRFVNKEVIAFASEPGLFIDLGSRVINKWRAIRQHQSQGLGNDIPIPLFLAFVLFGRREWYHKVDLRKDYPYKFIPFEI